MKRKKSKWMILLVLPVLLTSCQEERLIPPGPPVGDEISLVFSIVSGGSGTRSLESEEEKKINDIDVLVFKAGYFVERATGDIIPDNPSDNLFRVTLTRNDAPNNDIVAIANARQEVNNAILYGEKDRVLSSIIFEYEESDKPWPAKLEDDPEFRAIPMFGERKQIEINESLQEELTTDPILLYRALARVDVSSSAENFELTSVHFYKYNTKGCVAPGTNAEWQAYPYSSDPDNPEQRVTNVTIPTGTTAINDFLNYNVETGQSLLSSIYVMEIDRTIKRDDYSNATCLVVGGRYGGESSPVTYYRIDFEIIWRIRDEDGMIKEVIIEAGIGDALLGRQFARMLRNHVYEINITSASGPGAPSPEDALSRTEHEMYVQATTWYNRTLNMELKQEGGGPIIN